MQMNSSGLRSRFSLGKGRFASHSFEWMMERLMDYCTSGVIVEGVINRRLRAASAVMWMLCRVTEVKRQPSQQAQL